MSYVLHDLTHLEARNIVVTKISLRLCASAVK